MTKGFGYARTPSGEAIAYDVWDDGPVDGLAISTFVPLQTMWEHPGRVRMRFGWGQLMNCASVVARGTCESDPLPLDRIGDMDDWVADMLTVADHLGIERAKIYGEHFGAHAAVRFAATHPDRVDRIVLYQAVPRYTPSDDYAHGFPLSTLDEIRARIDESWGAGDVLDMFVDMGEDPTARAMLSAQERLAATPRQAARMFERMAEADMRSVLGDVRCPTLVMIPQDALDRAGSMLLAEGIPGAQVLEIDDDRFFEFRGEAGRHVSEFLAGRPDAIAEDRPLATVLFTDIVGSTQRNTELTDGRWRSTIEAATHEARKIVTQQAGRFIKSTGDGLLATFPRPGPALAAAQRIRESFEGFQLQTRAGLHMGEIEELGDGDIAGLAVTIAARICDLAADGSISVSSTITGVVAGSGRRFTERGSHALKGVEGDWPVFELETG